MGNEQNLTAEDEEEIMSKGTSLVSCSRLVLWAGLANRLVFLFPLPRMI